MSYFPGQIVSMRMENFMTFDDTEIKFHPNINLIIGPNGTGKSSIVSALCLGLGGTAATLGKHGNLAQFIKHSKGFSRLTIKLSSSNTTENFVTVQLTINLVNAVKQTTKLEWKLNNRVVSQAIITEKLQTYNINVNNLCQFLAQDRVIQLSKLNKFQLLQEFEETISHRNHLNFTEMHDRVITEQSAIKFEQANFKSVLKEIDFALKNKELYESDYLNLEKEKNLNMEIDKTDFIINKANLCLYEKQLRELDHINSNQKTILQEYQKTQSKYLSYIMSYEKQLSKLTHTNSSLTEQLKKIQTKFKQANTKYEKKKSEMEVADLEKENLITNIIETKSGICEMTNKKKDLEKFISDNKENANFDYVKGLIKENRNKITKLEKVRISLDGEENNLEMSYKNTESLIQTENNKVNYLVKRLKNKKMASVFYYNSRHRTHQIIEKLRMPKKFKGVVCGPLISEISTNNALVSVMVETAISNNMKFVYICNRIEDARLINLKVNESNLRVSIILQEPNKTKLKRSGDLEYLKQNNVDGYLDQFIECNDLVRSVLYDHCNIQHIAVSFNEPSVANMSNILPSTSSNNNNNTNNNKKCKVLYTKSKTFYTKTSFYNTSKVSINIGHYPPRVFYLFDHKEAVNALKRQNKKVYENLQKFEKDLGVLKEKMEETKVAKKENKHKIDIIKQDNEGHENTIGELINSEKELEDIESELYTKVKYFKDSTKDLSSNSDTSINILNSFYDRITTLQEAQENILQEDVFLDSLKALQKQVCKEEIDRIKGEKAALEEEHQNELATVKDYKENKKLLNSKIQRYKRIIKSHTYAKTKYKTDDQDDDEEPVDNIHLNMADVNEGYIKDLEEKLLVLENKNKYINYNVDNIKNYTRASKRINELSKVKEKKENYLNDRKMKFEYEAGNYVKELKTMVQNLDDNFSKLFKDITSGNGSGNVLLRESEDYVKLSLEILIRFRKNEQMKTLKHTLQSGGEKSFTTMVFLLSLQSMNSSPFRLVDEINQGMDAYNERRLMDTVKEKIGKTQYFIITPKLLSGFTFSENVKVHFVVNGPYIANKEVLDVIHQASKKVKVKDTNKNCYHPKKDTSIKLSKKKNNVKNKENVKKEKLSIDEHPPEEEFDENSTDDFLSEEEIPEKELVRNRGPRTRRAVVNKNANEENERALKGATGIMKFVKTKKKANTINRINRLFDKMNGRSIGYPNTRKRVKMVKSESDFEIESEDYDDQSTNTSYGSNLGNSVAGRKDDDSEIELSLSD